MRSVYAVQFEVFSRDPGTDKVSEVVLRSVASWISEWYLIRKSIRIGFPLDGGSLAPCLGHELTVKKETSDQGSVSHTSVSWSYPGEADGNLLWHSRCEISEFNQLTEFSLNVLLDSIQFFISPVEFNLKRPRVVGTLLRQFLCTQGGARLSLEPRGLSASLVPEFVQERLCSSNRRLPIVLVSRTTTSEKWLIDPADLNNELAGIAEVCTLDDKWAAYALSDEIGKIYSCYNGAVRIYWPDFDLAQRPYSPIYMPDKVLDEGSKLAAILTRKNNYFHSFFFSCFCCTNNVHRVTTCA